MSTDGAQSNRGEQQEARIDEANLLSTSGRFFLGLYHIALATILVKLVLEVDWQGLQDADSTDWLHVVLLAGALGSFVHAATSFVTYTGNRNLVASWSWWYVLRPPIGAVLALIFYFVLRSGLMALQVEAEAANPYTVAALAGLVGMFSKQAIDKLDELFNTMFRPRGGGDKSRADKVTDRQVTPVVDVMIPVAKIKPVTTPRPFSARSVTIGKLRSVLSPVVTRIPVIDDQGVVQCVVHQSVLYRYIAMASIEAARQNQPFDENTVTLANLMANPENDRLVSSLAFVARGATLGDAKKSMEGTANCQDVFVTETGRSNEPILGWLTNVDIAKSSRA